MDVRAFGKLAPDRLDRAVHPFAARFVEFEEREGQHGFMLWNYGRSTALVTLVLHLAYGAIVGAFAAGL